MATVRKRTLVAWSSGKDSAYALWVLSQQPDVDVVGLLTTLNASVDRVSMHGVHKSVLEAQARACRLPLTKVSLPDPCSDEAYGAAMAEAMHEARSQGVQAIAFGDLFLADVRAYREKQLAPTGISPLFPLWGRPTALLAREMLESGLEAIVTCVDTEQLDRSFVGRAYDGQLLEDLPASVDPCAENGEFHTIAVAGPMFRERLDARVGQTVDRQRFVFAEVALGDTVGGPKHGRHVAHGQSNARRSFGQGV
ncbi:MAG TPA: ATP-binding protein [Thermoleophilia bacterium]